MYNIIRLEDQNIVEKTLTLDEAEKKIIFYDSEESPHVIRLENPSTSFHD